MTMERKLIIYAHGNRNYGYCHLHFGNNKDNEKNDNDEEKMNDDCIMKLWMKSTLICEH